MAADHTIYLSSSACSEVYANNSPSGFTNRLNTPINLNSNIEYEMGLVSMLYPSRYYAIGTTEESIFVTSHIWTGKKKYI